MTIARLVFFAVAILAVILSLAASASEPTLVYERIHVRVVDTDNRTSLRVWADGRVEVHFPRYMRHAGTYAGQLSNEERDLLIGAAAALTDISQQQLEQQLQQTRQAQQVLVMDADLVRMNYNPADDRTVNLALPSPAVWSRSIPELADLARVAETEQVFRQWMRQWAEGARP